MVNWRKSLLTPMGLIRSAARKPFVGSRRSSVVS